MLGDGEHAFWVGVKSPLNGVGARDRIKVDFTVQDGGKSASHSV